MTPISEERLRELMDLLTWPAPIMRDREDAIEALGELLERRAGEHRVGDTVSITPIIGCPHVPTDGWIIARIDTDVSYALRHNVGGSIHVEAARLAMKSPTDPAP